MKISFMSDVRSKKVAKALKKCAEARGIEVKLTTAQNVIAQVYGYRDHRDLMMSIGQRPPSLWDCDLEPDEVRERHDFQAKALSRALGIEAQMAASIIAEIGPTAGRSTIDYDIAATYFPVVDRIQREPTVVVVSNKRKFVKSGVDGRRFFDLTRSNSSL
jgi:hypothetical protein